MGFFSDLGRSLMMPIAALAACGIVLGLSSALMKPQVQEVLPFLAASVPLFIISTLNKVSGIVFTLMPVLFAISIALGLAKEDKGVARECVRHDCVKEVTMVEIDGKVVELAKQYLPTISKAMIENNPKLTVKIGDGIGFMAEAEDYYDVIIVDCSDPIGPGEGLFTEEFYKNTLKALKADGLFVQQTESPMLHQPLVEKVFGYVNNHFPIARLYTAYIPIYPAGMHCFTVGSKKYDPLTWEPNREQNFETKYYNKDIQKAAFALPNFVKNYLPNK